MESETRLSDLEAVQRSNRGFKESLSAKVAAFDYLDDHNITNGPGGRFAPTGSDEGSSSSSSSSSSADSKSLSEGEHLALNEAHDHLSGALGIVGGGTQEHELISKIMDRVNEIRWGHAEKAAEKKRELADEHAHLMRLPRWRDTNPAAGEVSRAKEFLTKAASTLKQKFEREPEFRKTVYKEIGLAISGLVLTHFGAAALGAVGAKGAGSEGVMKVLEHLHKSADYGSKAAEGVKKARMVVAGRAAKALRGGIIAAVNVAVSDIVFHAEGSGGKADSDSDYENYLEQHVRNIVDEHAGVQAENARVAGESAAQEGAKIAAKTQADLEKKKAAAKARAAKEFEDVKKKAHGKKIEFATRLVEAFEYLDDHNLTNGPGGRFVRAGEGGPETGDGKSSVSTGVGGSDVGGVVSKLLADNPPRKGEATFEYQSRVVNGLSPELKHEVLFQIREHPAPVDFVAAGASKYRADHGLPEPQIDITTVKAPLEASEAVAKAFDLTPDQKDDPVVQAAFSDFKRQNAEMYDFITKPVAQGGLGITVEVAHTKDPYSSAKEQADDIQNNHHFFIESGLGGEHQATMTTEEYDHFRAVHDLWTCWNWWRIRSTW